MEKRLKSCKQPGANLDLNNKFHAYLFGYLWADGHIAKTGYVISSSSYEDTTMLKLYEAFGGTTNYRQRIQKETGTIKNCYEWYVSSVIVVQQFKDLGFRKTTEFIPTENLYDFLLGFLDGDGCIYSKDKIYQVSFSSKKEEDWTWFIDAVKRITNIEFKIKIRKPCWSKTLKKYTCSSNARITSTKALKFTELLYSNSNFGLERKKQKYINFLKYKENNGFYFK